MSSETREVRAYLLTQEDAFYIPAMLDRLLGDLPAGCQFVGAALLKGEISKRKAVDYLRLMGPVDFVRMGTDYVIRRALDLASRFLPVAGAYSVRGALIKHRIPIDHPHNVNDPAVHERLRTLDVTLVVSVSCPQIIRPATLALPPQGCINLHGAPLPRYRGLLPSFWVLAEGEEQTAVTVLLMNEKLDDGPIVVQRRVPIYNDDTFHSLVLRSKVDYGAPALAEALRRIRDGTVELQENDASQATYYSFPRPDDARRFRRRGRRFR